MNHDEHALRLLKDTYMALGRKDAEKNLRTQLAADVYALAERLHEVAHGTMEVGFIIDELEAMAKAMEWHK